LDLSAIRNPKSVLGVFLFFEKIQQAVAVISAERQLAFVVHYHRIIAAEKRMQFFTRSMLTMHER
jgi:hypothetical protein